MPQRRKTNLDIHIDQMHDRRENLTVDERHIVVHGTDQDGTVMYVVHLLFTRHKIHGKTIEMIFERSVNPNYEGVRHPMGNELQFGVTEPVLVEELLNLSDGSLFCLAIIVFNALMTGFDSGNKYAIDIQGDKTNNMVQNLFSLARNGGTS